MPTSVQRQQLAMRRLTLLKAHDHDGNLVLSMILQQGEH